MARFSLARNDNTLHPPPAVWMQVATLVLELAVLVLAKERRAHAGQGVDGEQLEALVKGVVDVDFAGGVEDY